MAVLDAKESERFFGVNVARRGIQPVHLRIENRSKASIRLQLVSIDPNYYTPLEAAALNHYSITKRLSAFGFMGWLFLPLLVLVPLKLITAYRANRRMDEFFRSRAFHLHPIPAGGASEGFVFTPFDAGTKIVHVRLVGRRGIAGDDYPRRGGRRGGRRQSATGCRGSRADACGRAYVFDPGTGHRRRLSAARF